MRYKVVGFTGPNADFRDEIDVDAADLVTCQWGDPRYNEAWGNVKDALLDSDCPGDFLDVFDLCEFEVRDDLAHVPGEIVLLAEAYGCNNCNNRNGEGDGDNERTDGCDDSPHGSYMITLTPVGE